MHLSDPSTLHGRRGGPRTIATEEVLVRRRGGCNFSLPLRNLSTHGCKVELIELVHVDEDVIARFPGLEPLGATVRWVEDDAAGLSFRKPLHPAVFDLLVARLNASAAEKRRRFRCAF